MSIEMRRHGTYETFETTKRHKILVLDDKDFYAWVKTSQGELLVKSDPDHEKAKTLSRGDYVLFVPHDERDLNDNVDHLELRKDGMYDEYILPNGLPTEGDKQKKLVESKDHPDVRKIEKLTRNS